MISLDIFQSLAAFTYFPFLYITNNVLDKKRLPSEFNLPFFPLALKGARKRRTQKIQNQWKEDNNNEIKIGAKINEIKKKKKPSRIDQ